MTFYAKENENEKWKKFEKLRKDCIEEKKKLNETFIQHFIAINITVVIISEERRKNCYIPVDKYHPVL